ncbi:MAG: hypothetical protein Q8P19_01235 [bacterium]|nr:hypothetical protein [bacterium]
MPEDLKSKKSEAAGKPQEKGEGIKQGQEIVPALAIEDSPLLKRVYNLESQATEEPEIECRFKMAHRPSEEELAGCEVLDMSQTYVFASDKKKKPRRFRLRITAERTSDGAAVERLSIVYKHKEEGAAEKRKKGKGGIVSTERMLAFSRGDASWEEYASEFGRLSLLTAQGWKPVEKTRYAIKHTLPNGHECTIHLDMHHGHLEGFGRVEVEFDTPEDAQKVREMHARGESALPDWTGEDVTDDERYGSKMLAQKGIPQGEA